MDFGEVDIPNIVCGVVVADLAAGPVNAFDLDCFAVLDGAGEGYCQASVGTDEADGIGRRTIRMPAIL